MNKPWLRSMTECKRGHAYTAATTIYRGGKRSCKPCRIQLQRERRSAFRAKVSQCE